jgi:putative heme iron utilization protein
MAPRRIRYDAFVTNRRHGGSRAVSSDVPEPSLAERARTLAAISRIGSLSTQSRRYPGFPFGSVMPFAADGLGRPVFFISSLAMHTQNLREDERAGLLIVQPDVTDDPLGAARVTLLGPTRPAPAGEVRDLYLSHYENARYWQGYTDFAYYRLEVEGVYFIGGFGVMGWVQAKEYRAAAPDPLAAVAPRIIQLMNGDHADILRGIAARETGENPGEVQMTSIDRLGFHLRLKTGDRVRGLRVGFPREVGDASEARAVFIEMA